MSCKDRYDSGNYTSPTPDEVREIMKKYNLTGSELGGIVGVTGRTVRRWTGGFIEIPYSCWRLLLIEKGEVSIE